MNSFLKYIQIFVLKTNRIWPLRILYIFFYILARYIIVSIFKQLPQVTSIYAKGATLSTLGVLGSSDIDLILIMKELDLEEELCLLKKIYHRYKILTCIFPLFSDYKTLSTEEYRVHSGLKDLTKGNSYKVRVKCIYGEKIPEPSAEDYFSDIYRINQALDIFRYLTHNLFTLEYNKYSRRYIKRIDMILKDLRNIAGLDSVKYLKPLDTQVMSVKADNYFINDSENSLFDYFIKTLHLIDHVCKKSELFMPASKDSGQKPYFDFSLTSYNIEPETKNKLVNDIQPFINEVISACKEVKCIFLYPKTNTNYQYSIPIVLSNGLDNESMKNSLCHLVNAYKKAKARCSNLSFPLPLLFTESMARFYINNVTSKLGLISFTKHGKIFHNSGIIADIELERLLKQINGLTLKESAYSFLLGPPLGTNVIETLIKSVDTKDIRKIIICLDIILGIIPGKRLLLAKEIITTSPKEVYQEYLDNFKGEAYTDFYRLAYRRFYFETNRKSFISDIEENLRDIHGFVKVNTKDILSAIKNKQLI